MKFEISQFNDLVYAGAVEVKEMLGFNTRKRTGMEALWKREWKHK